MARVLCLEDARVASAGVGLLHSKKGTRALRSSAQESSNLQGPEEVEFFGEGGHWTRGRYDDGNGGHCLVGALLHLGREHCLPTAPAIALLQDAMPRPGLPLVHFNDTCCGSVAELRSVILKARRLADDHAEQERAAAAAKAWLLAQIDKNRRTASVNVADTALDRPFAPERLAA